MSFWLKRVESFLESVEQTAAVQIGSLKNDEMPGGTPHGHPGASPPHLARTTTLPSGAKGKPTLTSPPSKPADDDIFKFLNDSDDTPPPSTMQKLAMPTPKPKKEPAPPKPTKKPAPTHTPTVTTTTTSTTTPTTTTTPTPTTPTLISPPPTPPSPLSTSTELKQAPALELTPEPAPEPAEPEPTQPPPAPAPEHQSTLAPLEVENGDEVMDNPTHLPPLPPSPFPPPRPLTRDGDHPSITFADAGWGSEDVSESGDVGSTMSVKQEVTVLGAESEKKDEEGSAKGSDEEKDSTEGEKIAETTQTTEESGDGEEKVVEQGEEEQAEEEDEEEEEEEEKGGLNAEFVQKYNDMITDNAKIGRENKLMRQEVVKLHEEINALTSKCRSVSEALSQVTVVLSEHQKMAYEKDKQLIKMKQQEQELETALHAKDMQQAGVRAQFEQVEKTLRMREATLVTYQERIEKLTQERESLLDGNQRNSQQIQDKVDELDRLMSDEKRQHIETQRSAKEREAELQAGLAEYTKALAMTQRSLDEKSLELQRSTVLLKEAQNESKTLRQELVDYKLRATKVLQSKEKAIQELTERIAAGPEGGGNVVANLGELLRAQQERDGLQQERDELSHTVDQLRGALQDVQAQAEADSEVFHTQLANSDEALEKERKRVQALQIDLLTRSSESASAQSEAERASAELRETLKSRDADLAKLRKQISAKSQTSSSQTELENRLRTTTDHLLQKQAQIDTLLSEKSFLQLQLEHTMQERTDTEYLFTYKKRDRQPHKNDHVPISIKSSGPEDDHDEPRIRQRPITSLVPAAISSQPNFVSQRVVGAANFLDKMSASAGRVMRQYPLARLGFIAYIIMMHLMGFYIMASWNPETHIDGFE